MAVSLHRGDDFDRNADGHQKVTASLTLPCTYGTTPITTGLLLSAAVLSTARAVPLATFPPK